MARSYRIHGGWLLACLVVDDVLEDPQEGITHFSAFLLVSMSMVIAGLISVWSSGVGGVITSPLSTSAAYTVDNGFAEVLSLY